MFEKPSGETAKDFSELTPTEGKDEQYDEVMSEINDLEKSLNKELERLKRSLGAEIYLVETSANQKQIPKDWTKSGSTKKDIRSLKEARGKRSTAIKEF
ncbi:hypothetical protein MPER_03339, partial [Moniliophthora perniciosa FA553]